MIKKFHKLETAKHIFSKAVLLILISVFIIPARSSAKDNLDILAENIELILSGINCTVSVQVADCRKVRSDLRKKSQD
ncbi:MAG: hypothetical protein IPM38_13730 [Ignavibacteria bacterium]|nr:hypothetical protein [Ignavibacteria bacterium]